MQSITPNEKFKAFLLIGIIFIGVFLFLTQSSIWSVNGAVTTPNIRVSPSKLSNVDLKEATPNSIQNSNPFEPYNNSNNQIIFNPRDCGSPTYSNNFVKAICSSLATNMEKTP